MVVLNLEVGVVASYRSGLLTTGVVGITCRVSRETHVELKAIRGPLGPRASGALCYGF